MAFDLKYHNDTDRRLGTSGRLVYLYTQRLTPRLAYIDMADGDGQYLRFMPVWTASGDITSPREAWMGLLREFRLQGALVIADAVCRAACASPSSRLRPDARAWLNDQLAQEGALTCSLERDECQGLFDEPWRTVEQIFGYPQARQAAQNIASHLQAHPAPDLDDIWQILYEALK